MKTLLALAALLLALPILSQTPAEWHDPLVDHLAGSWKLEGTVMGNGAHHDVQAD